MILVTGASGLLGANFVMAARQRHDRQVALFHEHPVHFPSVTSVQTDLRDRRAAAELLRRFRPQWVVHCAAATNVDWCEGHEEETWQINVEGSRDLAAAARRFGAGFAYISTDSVFPGDSSRYSEEDIPAPLNAYARSKLAGEQAVQEELDHSLIIRTNIYGWSPGPRPSLAEWMLGKLEKGTPIPGFCDVSFTPILVNDLSEILLDMMEQGLTGLYHVAASERCTKYRFALALAAVFGLDDGVVQAVPMASSRLSAARPRDTSLRVDKVSRALGRPMPDVESGLKRFKGLRDSGFAAQLKGLKGGSQDAAA